MRISQMSSWSFNTSSARWVLDALGVFWMILQTIYKPINRNFFDADFVNARKQGESEIKITRIRNIVKQNILKINNAMSNIKIYLIIYIFKYWTTDDGSSYTEIFRNFSFTRSNADWFCLHTRQCFNDSPTVAVSHHSVA